MSGLQETAANQERIAKEHLTVAEKLLSLQQAKREQELSDDEKKCLQLFRRTNSIEDATYEWYKDRVQERVEGTCNWFLQHAHFKRWLNQVSGSLLVSADPGGGKSVLAKYLVDHILPESATVCYYFFKDQDQNTARQALCALLHQLFSQKPFLLKHAIKQYEQDGKHLVDSTRSLWTILRDAVQDSQVGPIIIVLDALDECAESELEALMRNIEAQSRNSQSSGGALRYLMTSRPYAQIVQRFQGLLQSFPNIHIPGEEGSDVISHEINHVIKYRVEQLAIILKLEDEIQAVLLDALLKIEHRTYLWVHLMFDHLESEGFKKTGEGAQSATKTLPMTVNESYEKILSKSKNQEMARKALKIILAAEGALTLSQLNVAMEIGPNMESSRHLDLERDEDFKVSLRSLCGLFVSVYHGRVYFLHQTAREFLLANSSISTAVSQETGWQHSITMQDAHRVLAEQCMQYISLLTPYTRLATPRRGGHNRHQDVDHFLIYAATWWPVHFREARVSSSSEDSDISRLGLRLTDPNSVWIRRWSTQFATGRSLDIDNYWSHLAVVCLLGLVVLVKTLLDNNFNVNIQHKIYDNALQAASMEGHKQVVEILLDRGADADVNTQHKIYGNALQAASIKGHKQIVELLLNRGADVNVQGGYHGNALQAALSKGHKQIVEMLLDRGADVNVKDEHYGTALQAASGRGHKQIVEMLLDRGADINAQSGEYGNALQAALNRGHKQVVEILLDRGADVNAQGGEYGNALQVASFEGHEHIVEMLLDRGADINAQGGKYGNALQAAMKNSHKKVVEMLLNRGAHQPKRKLACVESAESITSAGKKNMRST
jgi:ankyrin repeat protein